MNGTGCACIEETPLVPPLACPLVFFFFALIVCFVAERLRLNPTRQDQKKPVCFVTFMLRLPMAAGAALFIVVFLFKVPAIALQCAPHTQTCGIQAWRLQRDPGQRGKASPALFAGHFHHVGGRTMALDAVGVLHELPALVACLRCSMVPDLLLA